MTNKVSSPCPEPALVLQCQYLSKFHLPRRFSGSFLIPNSARLQCSRVFLFQNIFHNIVRFVIHTNIQNLEKICHVFADMFDISSKGCIQKHLPWKQPNRYSPEGMGSKTNFAPKTTHYGMTSHSSMTRPFGLCKTKTLVSITSTKE